MTTKITCYDYGGLAYPNNTKCPSSDSCCQTTEQCRPDRLCDSNNNTAVIIRAACADYPWSLQTCAQICLYATETGFLPRVNICPDGSYCCDDDPECCATNAGVFLNSDGVAIGLANETTISSTMLSTSSPTVTAIATSLISTAPSIPTTQTSATASPMNQSQTSSTMRIAVGVTVPLGVLAILFISLGLFYYRRHLRPKPTLKGTTELSGTSQLDSRLKANLLNPAELWTQPAELPVEQR